MINKFYLIGIIVVALVLALLAGAAFYFYSAPTVVKHVGCTMEAKQCPDGSYVGRTGPNCEFTACPVPQAEGIVKGKVTVGPICPVERPGVPCPVPPEAYTSREVILYIKDGDFVTRKHFLADGTYSFSVPAGDYILDTPKAAIGGSKDLPKAITVHSGETVEVDFSIDTGIR